MLLLSKSLSSPQSKLLTHSTEDVGVEDWPWKKSWPKMNIFFINTFNDSEWHLAKTLMPSEALQADCLSGEVPWAEPFVQRNFSFERQWCGRCGPFQVHRVKACTVGCLKPAPETNFCWMNEHPSLFQAVNLGLSGEAQNMRSNIHKICRTALLIDYSPCTPSILCRCLAT